MSFNIVLTPDAKKDLKELSKTYRSFKSDFTAFIETLELNPQQGEPLGKDCYKVRLAISSKIKGKRGGARVITCVKVVDEKIYLVAVYDKADIESLPDKLIDQRLKNAGL
ncbi:type II toxin-antitoxin system RelE/ParE family toxin [Fibrella sp. HMF5335]|uniref:Type II toxin-antitoxin system RelE/ParE family toxin n=1 Tax=Fibrella rubiginis TaxID=2817060 RepID=A0A939K4Y9_9BACT|nr:type II toxin-antitoxin system RelE/ParE family toxin [Fibrella rubiginis]MBO0937208.1 type II toxin-antitoxin system RelE/ParE family toxin [Fibrella rubiginis]